MKHLHQLFDNLDKWRHLPAYQLERRADIFFSLYLSTALAARIGQPVRAQVIPEFPLKKSDSKLSAKVDYLAITEDGTELILVELKTDENSIRKDQMKSLRKAAARGGPRLCAGLNKIKVASRAKAKYEALDEWLREDLSLDTAEPESWPTKCRVVVIKPSPGLAEEYVDKFAKKNVVLDVISFEEFGGTVAQYDDPVSRRFYQSLAEWAPKVVRTEDAGKP